MRRNDHRLPNYQLPIVVIGMLFLSIISVSCGNNKTGKTEAELKREDSLRKDSIHILELKSEIASLDSEIALCEKEIPSLLHKFDTVHNLCSEKTYCHKNFWGTYTQRDHCLVCGVDTLGQLFMVANTYEGWLTEKKYEMYNRSDVVIVVLDSTFTTLPDSIYHSAFTKDIANTSLDICACAPVHRIFLNGSDCGILKTIALHPEENISFYFKWEDKKISPKLSLSSRYKKGIAESVALSDLITRQRKLEAEKAVKTKKLQEHS